MTRVRSSTIWPSRSVASTSNSLNQLAVDEEGGVRRFGLIRAMPVEHQTEAILGVHRKAVNKVRGVKRAQAGQIVMEQILGQRRTARANR